MHPTEMSAAMTTAEIQGSLLEPDVQACPFDYHAQLRERAPVYRMPETGFFVISTYDDLKTVLSDPATFSNDIMVEQLAGEAAADLGRMFDDHLAEVGWGSCADPAAHRPAGAWPLSPAHQPHADPRHGQGDASERDPYRR